MRVKLVAVLLLAGSALPALAQQSPSIERRVGKLENEMRAVQRRVFPEGPQALLEAEIRPAEAPPVSAGTPASSALGDLTARVDALERQLASVTNQTEENSFKIRQLEQALEGLRAAAEARAAEPVVAAPPEVEPTPAAEAPSTETVADSAPAPATGDPAEDAYLAGFRLWEAKRYAEAAAALEPVAKRWPKHRRASYAQNLLGRAYLDSNKPASAAKVLLSNYQTNPKGERAPDSLYFLGQALVALQKKSEACQVYDELADVYRGTLRDWVAQRLPKARSDAGCA